MDSRSRTGGQSRIPPATMAGTVSYESSDQTSLSSESHEGYSTLAAEDERRLSDSRPPRVRLIRAIRDELDGVSPTAPLAGLRSLLAAVQTAIDFFEMRERRLEAAIRYHDHDGRLFAAPHAWRNP